MLDLFLFNEAKRAEAGKGRTGVWPKGEFTALWICKCFYVTPENEMISVAHNSGLKQTCTCLTFCLDLQNASNNSTIL